jgi:probable phosphoglycerate mutase
MTRLLLVRHGETAWNADMRIQGHADIPLNDAGLAQARAAARAVADRPLAAVYTSDLMRAWQTADLVAAPRGLTAIRDLRLREASFGEWEGLTRPDIVARWPELAAAWQKDSLRTRPPGGETLEAVQARVVAFVDEIHARHPDDEIAIVAHGGSLRAIILHTLGGDLTIARRLRFDNCAVSTVEIDHGRYTLTGFNDTCHLRDAAPGGGLDETGDPGQSAAR